MGWRFKRIATGGMLAVACAAVLAAAGSAAAGERLAYGGPVTTHERAAYIAVGDVTRSPIGWVEFCVEYKPECNTKPSTPRDVLLTPKAWSDMVKVLSLIHI